MRADVVDLHAPSGYGKSILSEQLVVHWDVPAVRVRLVAPLGENPSSGVKPGELLDRLRRGARRAGVGALAAVLDDEEPENAIDSLLAWIAKSGDSIVLVIDDAQVLDDDAFALLDGVAADLPRSARLIVARRSTDSRTLRRAHELSVDSLRMNALDVTELLGDAATETVVSDVLAVTGGWPAAAAVVVQRLCVDMSQPLTYRAAGVRLLGSLIDDLLGGSADQIDALAELPLIDAWVADVVAGPGALHALLHSGLPYRVDGRWTQLPDSIRDALRWRRSARARSPAAALARVAEHYASNGELGAAVDVLVRAERIDDVVALLARQHWTDLDALGLAQLDQLLELVDDDDDADASVVQLILRAIWAAEERHPSLRTRLFERLTRLEPGSAAVARAVEAERVRLLSLTMYPEEAVALAETVLDDAPADELVTRARALLAAAHAHAVIGSSAGYAAADAQFTQAAALFQVLGEHRWQAEALARHGYSVLHHEGRPRDAVSRMEAALALLPRGDLTRARWLSSYADVLDTVGREIEARAAVSEAIEIGERLHDTATVGMALWTRAWMAGRRADVPAVRRALADVEALRPPWLASYSGIEFYGSLADHFVSLGDLEAMGECRAKALALHERFHYQEAIDMMSARIEAHIGDPARALTVLEALDSAIGAQANTRWVRRLEAALAYTRLGDQANAGRLVAEAFELVQAMGVGDLAERFEGPLLKRLRGLDMPGSTARLEVDVLGTFAVRDGYHDVTPPAGNPSMLVKLLVVRKRMTVDAVVDALWPEVDVDVGRARLRNTMNRLRARSGSIVERVDESLTLSPGVFTDLDAFEHASAHALAADRSQQVGLARRAIALYAGELLPGDVFEDWTAAVRERLSRRYVTLLDLVAGAAEADGSADEAARLLDMALAADPLDEARYVRLARLLKAHGRMGASRQVAGRGAAVFAELGLSPSAELSELL